MKLSGMDKLAVLVFFVIGIATFALLNDSDEDQLPASTTRPAPLRPSAASEFRGFALQMHNGDDAHPYEQYVDEIAASGANTLSLIVHGYQDNGSSQSIFIDSRKTPPDKRIIALANRAREKGLRVTIMPVILLKNARNSEWRGKISPPDWNLWWADYRDIVLRYARVATVSQAEVYIIGSELVSTELFEDRWRALIAEVRAIYPGRLAYSANWDHYRPIKWWDALDIIGMTTYYDLTGGDEPTPELLGKSWATIKADILAWQATINRPILFTEVGWPNQITCAQYPWNYYQAQYSPAPLAQANCFEAFFDTWMTEPSVAGYIVWEWRNHPGQKIGPEDTSYVPMGKPAMGVIKKHFRRPSPNPATNPAETAATTAPAPQ